MVQESPDQYITLRRAAQIAGLTYTTLKSQARPRANSAPKLRVVRLGPRTVLTTRAWLHEYLMGRDVSNRHAMALPADYVPPLTDGG